MTDHDKGRPPLHWLPDVENALAPYGLFDNDPALTYWEKAFRVIDRVNARLRVLDEHQRERLNALRPQVNELDPRQQAYVSGLFAECTGVAMAEDGGAQ